MAKYLFVYHGGSMPEAEEDQKLVMQSWMEWLGGMSESLVDGGNPLGQSSTVHPDSTVTADGGANPASGYTIINASSLEEALKIARGCPILNADGTVEVAQAMEI